VDGEIYQMRKRLLLKAFDKFRQMVCVAKLIEKKRSVFEMTTFRRLRVYLANGIERRSLEMTGCRNLQVWMSSMCSFEGIIMA
jgi:hypothetical protein